MIRGSFGLSALIFVGALTMTVTSQPSAGADNSAPRVRNVVLVHGAWADGSSWAKVIPLLQMSGLNAVAVQNPLTSLADDVAATKRAIARLDGPVILVGHSYGGAVISEGGNDPKVVGLVYVAAFAPDVGEAVGELGKEFPPAPGGAELRPDANGFLTWTTKPTWYVVAANDRMISPDLERKFARTMKAKTTELPTSHVAMLSRPTEVAKLIVEAAKNASQ